MAINCGIVGLPNVGKSTIFQALTSVAAEAANYPFCTIEPNQGIVSVQDERLDKITERIAPQKTVPTFVEFLDIAGLVKGASKGEGLGNQFLGHIRQVNAIIHIVRCFDDVDVVHVSGQISPIDDIEVINLELALADLDVVNKKLENLPKLIKSQNREISSAAKVSKPILEQCRDVLEQGDAVRSLDMSEEDELIIKSLNLITQKKVLYVCNIDEESLTENNKYVEQVGEYAVKDEAAAIKICGKMEAEIATLDTEEEKKEFLEAAGIDESGLNKLIFHAYELLGLKTYFTAGEKEVRAWTFFDGMKAPQTAGIIHTDFERGFIKAEVYHCEDLFKYGSEVKVKEGGKMRIEGREYVVQDGDIINFRFNV